MSKIDAQSLFKSAQKGAEEQEKYKQRKQARIQQCIEKFNGTCDNLNKKYFDPSNKFSINQSLDRACRQTRDSSTVKLYMNFDRDDFCNWHRFVPFKADEFGRNYNARPASCLAMYLTRAKDQGWLPENITFNVWGNKKFTVEFTAKFVDKAIDQAIEHAVNRAVENAAENALEAEAASVS